MYCVFAQYILKLQDFFRQQLSNTPNSNILTEKKLLSAHCLCQHVIASS